MRCQIPGSNLRAFAKSIQYLSRVADELFVEATNEWLTLSGVNNRKTAFASVKFEIEFFMSLTADDDGNITTTTTRNNNNTNNNQNKTTRGLPHCKLAMRSVTPLFRGLKNVELATISIDEANNCFNIEFTCRQKLVKTHSIAVLEFSRLKELRMPNRFDCKIIGTYKTFNEIVSGFHSSTRELCIDVTTTSISVRNHIDNPTEDKHSIRATQQLLTGEFETFSVGDSVKLSYSFPDFKAIVSFAELIDANIKVEFGAPGTPMRVATRLSSGMYSAMLFCATMPSGDDTLNDSNVYASSTQTSAASRPSQPVLRPVVAAPQQVPTNSKRPVPAKRKSQDVEDAGGSEFHVRRRKNARQSESHELDSDDLLPDMVTPDLPRNIEVEEEIHQPPPPLIVEESKRQESNHEPEARLEVSDQRRQTIQAPPMSVEVLFETESTEGNCGSKPEDDTEESVPGSPRRQLVRRLFRRCYEDSFRPSILPGADIILAPNSDEEDMDQG